MPVQKQLLSAELINLPNRQGVNYRPYSLDQDVPPRGEVFRPTKLNAIEQRIGAVHTSVNDLIKLARLGRPRGSMGIEGAAELLAMQIRPSCGFAWLIAPGAHPQLEAASPTVLSIPWEVLEERYLECPQCREPIFSPESKFCPTHGVPLERRGGKLALTYQLSIVNRGDDRSVGQGNGFLLISDPRGDLSSDRADPDRRCRDHVVEIAQLLNDRGYMATLFNGRGARYQQIMAALRDPSVIGIYYFGHGDAAKAGTESRLFLADGELTASDIQLAAPGARFVFLNACLGAAAGEQEEPAGQFDSVSIAAAFLGASPRKVVIAPLFRVFNLQAAESALTFFRTALDGATCGEALAAVRQDSFARYEAGEPHISWMAYRYFGDPNRPLPAPEVPAVVVPGPAANQPLRRVFNAEGAIDLDLFSFAIDEVLARAAKRRVLQDRPLVGSADLLAGLVRRGDLTRYLLLSKGVSPDKVYARLAAETDTRLGLAETRETGATTDRSSRDTATTTDDPTTEDQADPSKVERADQLGRQLQAVFEAADRDAQAPGRPSVQICEQDLLLRLIDSPDWIPLAAALALPDPDAARGLLAQREAEGRIDGNGGLILRPMTADARRIVEIAHTLAQQCGACPIPQRVMLAALLQPDHSYAERCFERAGVDAVKAYMWLLATTVAGHGGDGRHWFGLSLEAADHSLLQTLERAQALANGEISERDLFQGFCDVVSPQRKDTLKALLHVDLNELRGIEPDQEPECVTQMTPEARRIIFRAHRRAQRRGRYPIPPDAVLAAFLADPEGLAALLLREQGLAADRVAEVILEALGPGRVQKYPLDAAACREAVAPAVERARALAGPGKQVSEANLLQAFCETAPPAFKAHLSRSLTLDLDRLGQRAASGVRPEPGPPRRSVRIRTAPRSDRAAAPPAPAARPPRPVRAAAGTGTGWVDRSRLDPTASASLDAAVKMAHRTGWTQVRTPHLVAAMIAEGNTPTATLIAAHGVDPMSLKTDLLRLVPDRGASLPDTQEPELGDNLATILARAIAAAAARADALATAEDIFVALTGESAGPIGEILRRLGLGGQTGGRAN